MIVLLLFAFSANAQQYECFIGYEKEDIRREFRELQKQNEKYQVEVKDTLGGLQARIRGFENITCRFFFNYDSICESATFTYCCNDCSEKHIAEFIFDPYYGFLGSDGVTYYSKRKRNTCMVINSEDPSAVTITFTMVTWSRKQHKELRHKARVKF